jgi:tryptophan halogenase
MINSICVLGGGNAGLMNALYLKASIPHLDITLVKSSKIGTIGVGEGSTEHWTRFANAVGISFLELIEHCGATIKTGIKFENWHGDGTSYFHSLPEDFVWMDAHTGATHSMMRMIGDGIKAEDMHWKMILEDSMVMEPLTDYYQFHFDSEKLNAYLQTLCTTRGIKIVEAEVVDCILDNDGFVQSIVDSNNQHYAADFFIDSSGFKRVISSKLGATWIDWSAHLPMNSAVAFQTTDQDDIPVYTLAKAMDSGWSWRSPVQGRFGNGYVFSDQFITEDQAIAEIQTHYKDTINIGRKINFTSGKVNKAWIKNCVSIGLSSNFVEPLEASSISTTIQQSRLLASAIWNWDRNDTSTINEYNRVFDDVMWNVLDFIQLHYFTQREDTEFWRWCKHDIKMTEFNQANIENFKTNFINQVVLPEDGTMSLFRIYDCLNWAQVMHGLRMFDTAKIKELYDKQYSTKYRVWCENNIKQMHSTTTDGWMKHKDAIALVKQRLKGIEYSL